VKSTVTPAPRSCRPVARSRLPPEVPEAGVPDVPDAAPDPEEYPGVGGGGVAGVGGDPPGHVLHV